jgi:hypothetical protein
VDTVILQSTLLVVTAIALAAVIMGPRPWISAWLDRRRLAQKAESYGIDYIPGENLDHLRARLIQEREQRATTKKNEA